MTVSADALFALFAHPLRLRALMLLVQEGELCVCELTHALDVSQPMISRHLAQLRQAGVVRDRREGLWVHYSVSPELPDWARRVLEETHRGLADDAQFPDDRAALAGMPGRPPARCCG